MRLDRAWIERHIPHHGRMCLLEEVIVWDVERISCRCSTHREAEHPLKAHGRLGIASGVEYAGQAMAVHGALLGVAAAADTARSPGHSPAAGFLVGLRNVRAYVTCLDDVAGDLICEAERIAGDPATSLYDFELRADARCLLRGRATVVLDPLARRHP